MINDNFASGKEAKDKLIAGFDKIADAVKGTLGAAGYNFLSEHQFRPFAITSNDGVTLANNIYLADPFEQLGANLVKEIANASDKQSHDGTTTATVLAQAILHAGKDATIAPMQLDKELNDCLPLIEKSLNDQKRDITVDDVGTVATVSAGDPTIGAMIQEIYQKIGKDGILFRDISQTFSDHYTLDKGIHMEDAGFVSPYMAEIDREGRMQPAATLKNVRVLITKQKISSHKDLEKISYSLFQQDIKELVVFCDDIESLAIAPLVLKRNDAKPFRFLIVKMPTLWKDWWFEDLAAITGATIVDPAAGVSFKTLGLHHLGEVGSITVDKSDTYIEGIKDITEHLANLAADGTDDSKLRIARLNQKTARYFVGAPTDQALSYRRLKVEDACGAAYWALQNGVVAGGGVALYHTIPTLPDTQGANMLKRALTAPIRQIMKNAGAESELVGTTLSFSTPYFKRMDEDDDRGWEYNLIPYREPMGYDAKNDKFVNLLDAGICDPTTVVLNSARNAISTAAKILTVGVITLLPKQEVATQNQGSLLQ